ncbi:hypothetical protein BDP81DRAFT_426569 [Colletotrichum phormii]|uniref:Uncharacterized protein n=1 Tax=Colletotrichum phormii TaxID=359342 RepID=A0AAI9ZRX7_9PEZI|nr:uncharacterized protein BDP81DRAFT_426569 [Colletotrichum phormii]KAK1637066.1 hypothetical protein BDP81DRAFT_426569 [Colletotrichum phormii]
MTTSSHTSRGVLVFAYLVGRRTRPSRRSVPCPLACVGHRPQGERGDREASRQETRKHRHPKPTSPRTVSYQVNQGTALDLAGTGSIFSSFFFCNRRLHLHHQYQNGAISLGTPLPLPTRQRQPLSYMYRAPVDGHVKRSKQNYMYRKQWAFVVRCAGDGAEASVLEISQANKTGLQRKDQTMQLHLTATKPIKFGTTHGGSGPRPVPRLPVYSFSWSDASTSRGGLCLFFFSSPPPLSCHLI